jgi:hypothetical protein
VRHKKVEKKSYLKGGSKKWRKLISEVRHKKVEKNSYQK